MRRVLLVLSIAAVMAMMMVAMAAPAMAQGSNGIVSIDTVGRFLTVTPPATSSFPTDPIRVALPTDPIKPAVLQHNPNVVPINPCDGC